MSQNQHEEGRQWLRACALIVGPDSGEGLDLSALRITFATKKGDVETPNSAEINVYNLSDDTAARIRREFMQVYLSAGYEGNTGTIFRGNIRQVRLWRENGVDTVLAILAADGDRAYNFATVNTTLAAGSKPADRVRVCQGSMEAKGTKAGYAPDLGGQPLPRGKVMYGMARQYMRDEARDTGTDWSIQDGKVQMVPRRGYLPGEAVVLTHETGLVGSPEQTQDGISVRCLLNPRLRVGGRIRLNNASVKTMQTPLKLAAGQQAARLDADGFYRIIKVEFRGDTRGNDWYADLVCIGIDDTARLPLDQAR